MQFSELKRDISKMPSGETKTFTDAPMVMHGIHLCLKQLAITEQIDIIDIVANSNPDKNHPISITIMKRWCLT